MRPQLPDLPLLYEDDSYIISLANVGTKCFRILRIIRYPRNQNTRGVEENFKDLDYMTKRAVIEQINKRCVGRTVIT